MWSFDRIVPEKLSYVSDRTHTAVYAVILFTVVSEIGFIPSVYGGWGAVVGNAVILLAIGYLITSISGILFPFRQRAIFDQSPSFVKAKIGPIYVISIIGIYATATSLFLLWAAITNSWIGGSPQSYPYTFLSLFLGPLIYYIAKWYRARHGIDLSLAFKALPPE